HSHFGSGLESNERRQSSPRADSLPDRRAPQGLSQAHPQSARKSPHCRSQHSPRHQGSHRQARKGEEDQPGRTEALTRGTRQAISGRNQENRRPERYQRKRSDGNQVGETRNSVFYYRRGSTRARRAKANGRASRLAVDSGNLICPFDE